jgi:hypothetical protein
MRRFVPLLIAFLALTAFFALAPPARAAWVWPVTGEVITQYRNGTDPYATGQHRGIDIAAPVGTPVVAAAGGEVRFAGTAGSSGLTVGIRTGDGYDTSYLHLSSLAVRAGAEVSAGERIGAVGTTGVRSAAVAHLHFGVRDAGTRHDYHDPMALLPPPSPPAHAPGPSPQAPVTAPQPPPPAAAPVSVPRVAPRPHAVPRVAPRPHAVPRVAPRPHAVPRRLLPPVAAPRRVPAPLAIPRRAPAPLAVPRRAPRPVGDRTLAEPSRDLRHPARHLDPRHHAVPDRGVSENRAPAFPTHVGHVAGLPLPRGGSTGDARAGFDIGWAAACAGLLLAAGLLGLGGRARGRADRARTGGAAVLRPLPRG